MLIIIAPFCFSQLRVQQLARPLAGSNLMPTPVNKYISQQTDINNFSLYNKNYIAHEIASSSVPPAFGTGTQDSQLTKFRMKKSPLLAVLLSAVLPGAGQFYNRSYWKIPIIGGLIGYFGYEYVINNNKFKDYRDQYDATITPSNQFGDENLKTLREFYRNQRDDFVWYFIIVYVVNLVDAYVDAHLFDFDVKEEKLVRYGKNEKSYRLKLKIQF